ncbi:putative serine esterase-domain-containing protein [Coniochaeta sp. 2T2.1]|nr:putative serine esterase-domain-containing protein [Coniochaeta sp. 2T2.1]
MLLLHQVGSVKIGEVVRYTVTYTPSADRILPSPEFLHLRVRNTCAIALRAAFVHGPYTLSVAAYPSHFNPNEKFQNPRRYGVPEFEPMLKAGGTWTCHLVVPDNIRQSAGAGAKAGYFGNGPGHEGESCSWVIEVASQVIFSTSAAVNFEVLLARDEKSLNLGTGVPVIGGQAQVPQPGRVSDYQGALARKDQVEPTKGVFSRAVRLKVEDTGSLWDTPRLPGEEHGQHHHKKHKKGDGAEGGSEPIASQGKMEEMAEKEGKPRKVHLVVLTHGLHSNLGADMLFLKESIDAGVQQAKKDAKVRRAREREERRTASGKDDDTGQGEDDGGVDEDEEVIVRGFSGNATRTERGIKYLGKRLARFVLSMTYPDQPFLPTGKAASEAVSQSLFGAPNHDPELANGTKAAKAAHKHSTTVKVPLDGTQPKRLYKITKISFIAHSLGGLVQTYAVAYVQKHSPQFFDLIEPVNFIALASPFLGLNHENPLYVKFALDFGLVGRTGQDLGLTWRAPTIARSGWGALVSNLGENAHKKVYGDSQPESKPLLRILPTGPAHIALKKFRNRTLYSNVVNDGIVPLRTSCLLFLDWQGLERVEKARREVGLVETVVRTGWAEITGTNVTTPRMRPWVGKEEENVSDSGIDTPDEDHEVPQPPTDATREDDSQSLKAVHLPFRENKTQGTEYTSRTNNHGTLSGLFNFFRIDNKDPPPPTPKQNKIYRRSQTINFDDPSGTPSASFSQAKVNASGAGANGGATSDSDSPSAPPRTSFFESASDLLNPQLPTVDFIIDPSKRPRTIFHDRIYHPSDIPPPPLKRRPTNGLNLRRRSQSRTTSSSASGQTTSSSPFPSPALSPKHQDSSLSKHDYDDTAHTNPDKDPDEVIDSSNMRVEEKIARAYHRDLSWRKVLVKLEPDAHNNLIVRRMFANAFGWPVVKHLVEAHFSDSATARTRDEYEAGGERARPLAEGPDYTGQETKGARGGGEGVKKTGHGVEGLGIVEPAVQRGRSASQTEPDGDATPKARKTPALPTERTASEDREDTDKVSELPKASPRIDITDRDDSGVVVVPQRPPHERNDSVSWSERDWVDSGDENSDEDGEGGKNDRDKDKDKHGEGSWNWTEKIVGKGAVRAKSPVAGSSGHAPLGHGGPGHGVPVAGAAGHSAASGSGAGQPVTSAVSPAGGDDPRPDVPHELN